MFDAGAMEFVTASDIAHAQFSAVANNSIQKLLSDYNARFSKTEVSSEKRSEFELQSHKSRGRAHEDIDMKLIRVKFEQVEFYQLLLATNTAHAESYYGHLYQGRAQIDLFDFPGVTKEIFDDKAEEVMGYLAGQVTIRKLCFEETVGLLAILDKTIHKVELIIFHPATSIIRFSKDFSEHFPKERFDAKVVHPLDDIRNMAYSDFIAREEKFIPFLRMSLAKVHGLDLAPMTFGAIM